MSCYKYKVKRWSIALFLILLGSSLAFATADPIEIKIGVLPGLQFDKARFHVKPGQQVKLLFNNTDDMDHNFLITRQNSREKVVKAVEAMGGEGIKKGYIPSTDDVLWSIPLVSSEHSKSLNFTAPREEGVYPYVCTVPGHGYVMFGAMYVNDSGEMPEIEEDIHIPETRRISEVEKNKKHPYSLEPPYYYRTYVEGASPAAIIVRLPKQLSYCWDAGVCRFRFAWKGDFVDNEELWKGHRDAKSEILGDVFYREEQELPIQIGNKASPSKKTFKGYKITDGGYLEFHFVMDGMDVFETIKEWKDGKGLVRTFRIPGLKEDVYFNYTSTKDVQYYYKDQALSGNRLKIPSKEGTQFSVALKIVE